MQNIEKTILASVLNGYGENQSATLNKDYFSIPFHRKLVIGINRLRELDKLVDFELLRNSFLANKKWSLEEEHQLLDVMERTPLGSKELFNAYLEVLKDQHKLSLDRKFAL